MVRPGTARLLPGTIAVLAIIVLLMPTPALAYIDPSTGGVLTQLITGGVAGIVVFVRLYWRRLKGAVSSRSTETQSVPSSHPSSSREGE